MKRKIKPHYFENQKQAASILGLDEYQLKEWKAQGYPAFRYGRIYHAELLEWIEAKRRRPVAEHSIDASDEIVTVEDWGNRRSVLFDVLEYLHDAYRDGRIDLAKYAELGDSTVELLIKIGEVWNAGIDAKGYRKTWLGCLEIWATERSSLSVAQSTNLL